LSISNVIRWPASVGLPYWKVDTTCRTWGITWPLSVRDLDKREQIMPEKLTFEFAAQQQQEHAVYDWLNIDRDGVRVGKVRGLIEGSVLTICSINIFPEFERCGFARKTIDMFKQSFDTIIADRVRHTAVGFWEKMGFVADGKGNYVWGVRQG